jgi:hypothetical protein
MNYLILFFFSIRMPFPFFGPNFPLSTLFSNTPRTRDVCTYRWPMVWLSLKWKSRRVSIGQCATAESLVSGGLFLMPAACSMFQMPPICSTRDPGTFLLNPGVREPLPVGRPYSGTESLGQHQNIAGESSSTAFNCISSSLRLSKCCVAVEGFWVHDLIYWTLIQRFTLCGFCFLFI